MTLKTGVMMLKIQLCIKASKEYIVFNYIQIENCYFKLSQYFYCILDCEI